MTYTADAALPRLVPTALAALWINAVTDREITRASIILTKGGLAESSVRRFRDSLSSFSAWAVRERMIPPTRSRRLGHRAPGRFVSKCFPSVRTSSSASMSGRPRGIGDSRICCGSMPGLACAGQSYGLLGSGTSSRFRCQSWWCSARSPRALRSRAPSPERPVAFRLPTASCRSCEPWLLIGTQTPVYSLPSPATTARHGLQADTRLDHYRRGPTHSRPTAHGRLLVAGARS